MGCVYKRGQRYWLKFYRNGKPIFENAKTTDIVEARRLLRLREGDVERGVPTGPKVGRITFDEAMADLLNEYKANGRRTGWEVELRIKKHLSPVFKGKRPAELTAVEFREYIARRQAQGAANATINRELSAIRRAYTLAFQAGKLAAKAYVPVLVEDNVRSGWFEEHQYEAVRDRLPDYVRGVVTFAYITGWRTRSEVLPLTWKQVDFRGGTVMLSPGTTKNRQGRTFPFTRDLRALLEAQRAYTTEMEHKRAAVIPWVFHRRGKRIMAFRKVWERACDEAACPGRILHDFRRTGVRNLVRAGIPERVAMQLTGHKTRSVFERYNIVSENDLRDAARRIDLQQSHTSRTQGL